MEEAIPFVFMAAAFLGVVGLAWRLHVAQREAWRKAAQARGLQFHDAGFFGTQTIEGSTGGVPLVVDTYTTGGKNKTTWTRVRSPRRLVGLEKLQAEDKGFLGSLGKALVGPEVKTGDPAFDEQVLLRGEADWLRPRLDAAARLDLSVLTRNGSLRVADGAAQSIRRGTTTDVQKLLADIDAVVGLVATFSGEDAPSADRLLEIVRSDPAPGVRVRCLRQLLRDPETPQAGEALAIARDAADPDLRRCARVHALRRAESVAWEDVKPLLSPSYGEDRILGPELTARHRLTAGRDAMARLLGDDDDALVAAAARALAVVGSREQVEALLPLTRGLLIAPSVKSAAKEAVAAIQGRLGDSPRGGLALAAEQGGELALAAQAKLGALSQAASARTATPAEEPASPRPPPNRSQRATKG